MKPAPFVAAAYWLAIAGWPAADLAIAADKPGASRDATWVDKTVEAWQPTKAERAFDAIGWAKDLREAERLAKEHGRLIFLFTYDGESLGCFRC